MRLLTWNTLGERWAAVKGRIDKYDPDVFVLQEAGNLPRAIGYAGGLKHGEPNLIGSYKGLDCWYLPWDRQGGTGNVRCSMAMLFGGGGGPSWSWSTDTHKRPMMTKTVNSKYVVSNIHAGGQAYINEAIQITKTRGTDKTWIVAGDFNQGADEDLSWMEKRGGDVVAPRKATRPSSGRILDYAVSSDGLAAAAVDSPSYGGSDHLCVHIDW